MDYEKIEPDFMHGAHEYKEWYEVANSLGYKYVSQALVELYQTYSLTQIGKMFGRTSVTIHMRLKHLGVELRPRGGDHRVWLSKDTKNVKRGCEID